ncbi:carbonic anhydrase 1-like isoform X2 [Schistocerca gregaria]|uniref:carbonic anhydrase 1-like isoform X2 n=1 Tax=Schistocerca gregaria TaxID=7010 RepID=UPI00211E9992|nr:carbonic anhydrase 1-like isoform X2 [Schistocerca gregaria]
MPPHQCIAVIVCTLFSVTVLADERRVHGRGNPKDPRRYRLSELLRPFRGDFGYEGEHGPVHWPSTFPECGGRAQSPLDIPMSQTESLDIQAPLEVPDFMWSPYQFKILNNGHTVQLQPVDTASVENTVLRGGPLTGEYQFLQLHFHWGESDDMGSEHAVDGSYYAMEMHMVFSRKAARGKENSYREHGDAAVLAVFLELADDNNPALRPVVSHLQQLQEVDSEVQPQMSMSTAKLVPEERGSLLVYNGSLTTPPCSETVTWIIFRQPITVSSNQVEAFRRVKSPHGQLRKNRRPVQPLNDRTVYTVSPNRKFTESATARSVSPEPRWRPSGH